MPLTITSAAKFSLLVSATLLPGLVEAREGVFLSLETLERSRQAVVEGDADKGARESFLRLIEEAELAMEAGPFSVTDKGMVPPSGSRNDYLSISPYWWPDERQPDGLPWVRRDGEVNPASKTGETDSRRIGHFTRSVRALALASAFDQNRVYGEQAASYLRTWFIDPTTRMNPNMNFAQGVPGVAQGRRGGIIDSRSLVTRLLDSIAILEQQGYLSVEDSEAIDAWYDDYLDWLVASELGISEAESENNHGTWYNVQVAAIADFLGRDAQAQAWVLHGRRRLGEQFAADGTQPHELGRTRSYHYSYFNLDAHSYLAQIATHQGIPYWDYRTPEGTSLLDGVAMMASYHERADEWPWPTTAEPRTLRLMSIYRKAALASGDEALLALSDSADFSAVTVEEDLAEVWSQRDVELLYPLP